MYLSAFVQRPNLFEIKLLHPSHHHQRKRKRNFRGSWLFHGRWLQEVKGQYSSLEAVRPLDTCLTYELDVPLWLVLGALCETSHHCSRFGFFITSFHLLASEDERRFFSQGSLTVQSESIMSRQVSAWHGSDRTSLIHSLSHKPKRVRATM